MSRVGRNPIEVPDKVQVKVDGATVHVSGPGGQMNYTFTDKVKIALKDKTVVVEAVGNSKEARAMWGTTRSLINNMVIGVTQGFEKRLEFNGVGYKAMVKGDTVVLNLGYSHPINYKLPTGVSAKVAGNVITLSSMNKELVGFVAAKVRSFRPPEPYKGKGVKYVDEVIIKKAGKTGGKK